MPGEGSKTSDSELSDAEASQMMVKVWMFSTWEVTRLDGVSTKLFRKWCLFFLFSNSIVRKLSGKKATKQVGKMSLM